MSQDKEGNRSLDKFREYLRLLARMKMHKGLRSKRDTSDLIQDVFLKAYGSLDELQGQDDRQIAAWLRTILVRVVLDENRRYLDAGKRSIAHEQSLQATVDDTSQQLERFVAQQQPQADFGRVLDLADALATLSADERTLIEKRYVEQKTLEQLTDELGMPRTTLMRKLQGIHKQLRKYLTPKNI